MKKSISTGILFMLLTSVALAARDLSKVSGWQQLILDALKAVSWLFWVVAIVMIFYAAYLFVTGGDNEDTISKAKQTLLYAVIGIAVALIATAVPSLVQDTLGIGAGGQQQGGGPSYPSGQ